jgi:peptidoglycan/LPS O-acetylase OafA/YrhL
MAVNNAKLADRAVSAIAACAYLRELFEVAQQSQAGWAVSCAVMAMCFVPGIFQTDPGLELRSKAWYLVGGKAIWAALTYGVFQGVLDEWKHGRFGGVIGMVLVTAFFILGFYYGSERRGPWDLWLARRRFVQAVGDNAEGRDILNDDQPTKIA